MPALTQAPDQRPADAARRPGHALWEDPLGSLGKIVGALAGAGVFLYLIGVGVLWERLASAGLQPQEVIAALPRDQIAVTGAREALLLSISGAIFGLYLYAFYRLFRACERVAPAGGLRARLAGQIRQRPAVVVTAMVAAWCAPLVPLSLHSVGPMLAFLAVVFVGLRSAHRSLIGKSQDFRTSRLPWLRVVAGLSASVLIVSIAHEREFPARFATAIVSTPDSVRCGLYLGGTSDVVVLGERPSDFKGRHIVCRPRPGLPWAPRPRVATTVMIPRDRIRDLELTRGPDPREPASSILDRLGVPLDCLTPDCRIGSTRHGLLQPFGIGS
jgi:hypothetical protein